MYLRTHVYLNSKWLKVNINGWLLEMDKIFYIPKSTNAGTIVISKS